MDIEKVAGLINGTIIVRIKTPDDTVSRAFASDLMSDVLTLNTDSLLLITGMANMQTIRTAEMADIKNILFVRNKKPTDEMIKIAKQERINILTSPNSMFAVCGILYSAGIKPVY